MQKFSFNGKRFIFRSIIKYAFGDSRYFVDNTIDRNGAVHSSENGQFVKKGTSGVSQSYKTYTNKKDNEGHRIPNKENASDKMSRLTGIKSIREKGGYTRDSLIKFKNVPRNNARTISEYPPELLYNRSDNAIKYESESAAEGKPKYEWTQGGRKLTEAEALDLEAAMSDIGAKDALTARAKSVKVRPDLYNGRGQIATGKGINSYCDPYSNYERNKLKYQRVNYWKDNYNKLLDKIDEGIKKGDNAAYLAYFMHRTRSRVGSSDSAQGLGASQLKAEHFKIDGKKIICDYRAKNGLWHIEIEDDPILREYLTKRLAEADPKEKIFKTSYEKESSYLKKISNEITGGKNPEFGNHDFRRVGATLAVADYMESREKDIKAALEKGDEKAYKSILVDAINNAAGVLNDKPSTALEHYISPDVLFKDKPEWIDGYIRTFSKLGKNEGKEYGEIKE